MAGTWFITMSQSEDTICLIAVLNSAEIIQPCVMIQFIMSYQASLCVSKIDILVRKHLRMQFKQKDRCITNLSANQVDAKMITIRYK